ncbi:MAG TPA: hypothetical protein VN718_00145 [Rhizomicrobium sp.]|nr:hypothetical protein [Rhizomicrobium sp.]
MARIRTIKPEFPHSESMGRVSREARLLFLMLFTIVDDEGRARAAPRMLASLLFPYDDDANSRIGAWLAELERENCVALYEVDGNAYLRIANWLAHQRIDMPSRSRLPPPPSTNPREASPQEGKGTEGKGEDGKGSILSDVPSEVRDFSSRSQAQACLPRARDSALMGEVPVAALAMRRAEGEKHYEEGFLAFWREYPTDSLMSKKRALEQWRKLSPAEREAAKGAIPAFRDYCGKHPAYRPVHAERFLSEKRFEGFAQTPALSPAEIEANRDRADKLMRRGKYAVNYQ